MCKDDGIVISYGGCRFKKLSANLNVVDQEMMTSNRSKKGRIFAYTVAVTVAISGFWVVAEAQNASVDYPAGYRSWQHVKSMLIQPGHPLEDPFQGIHHVYANSKAMSGLASGQYEDGAVFVFDLLGYDDKNKLIVETARKRLDVMQYDSKLFSKTDNWGYETFVGDSRTQRWNQDVVAACYGCHIRAKKSNNVFSKYRP